MMAVVTEPVATGAAAVVPRGVSDLFLYAFHAQSTRSSHPRARRAQWVKRPTENPGAMLTRVQVPGAARDSLPESTSCADSLTVSVKPQRAIACINICACVKKKNPKFLQPYPCLDTRKYFTY